jgi:two-component system OmpR family response regulator
LTAKVKRHEVEGYLDFGGTRVIAKPFDPMTLAIEIQELWPDMDQ